VGHFCVNCGAPLVATVIESRELEACPNDGFVLWRDPKVAAAVVVEADGGVVLGRRAIEPGYGLWCLPGGFVNQDEDPAAAALRECLEEIGAAVEITELLGVYHIAKTAAASIVGIAYLGRLVDGEQISVGSEMLEVRVFALDALPEIAFPSHQSVLAGYLRSRERPVEPGLLNAAAPVPPASPPSPGPAPSRPPRRR
jgi:ADP-ribose pyrophosphatase YjhB (NUDIX family)